MISLEPLKLIGAVATFHDQSWYDGKIHFTAERYPPRIKQNFRYGINGHELWYEEVVRNFYNQYDVVALNVARREDNYTYPEFRNIFEDVWRWRPKKLFDHWYYDDEGIFIADHHQAHAVYAYLQSGFDECDIFVSDGGAGMFTSLWSDPDQNITDLSPNFNFGSIWDLVGKQVLQSFRSSAQSELEGASAGKVMGLAAYGKLDDGLYNLIKRLMEDGITVGKGIHHEKYAKHEHDLETYIRENKVSDEDVAMSAQQALVDLTEKLIVKMKKSDNICLSGGVAYNGYMNEVFAKHYKNVFVPPAVGDEGQSLGMYMMADYVLNNNTHIPSVYAGVEHEIKEEIFSDMNYERMNMDDIYPLIAKEIANGAIVGWYQGRSESGNRALGNRSILADPRNPEIKNIINRDIKKREDFRPFAPSVLIEDYQEYFDTNQPSPYMSRIMPVREEMKSVVPGIVHVDGTARIQTVEKSFNEKYWKLINAFKEETGVPMLLNTSFNCQEPIVETPQNAVDTFKRTGLHYLVIEDWVCKK